MTSGPLIPKILDGGALLGSQIRTALKNIQDFLTSIPVDNLERFNIRTHLPFQSDRQVGVAATVMMNYQKLGIGSGAASGDSSKVYAVEFQLRLSAAIAGGDDFTVTLEQSGTVDGVYTTVTGCSAQFTAGSPGAAVETDGTNSYGYYKQVTPGATTIAAAQFLRVKVVSDAGSTRTVEETSVVVGVETRLQP